MVSLSIYKNHHEVSSFPPIATLKKITIILYHFFFDFLLFWGYNSSNIYFFFALEYYQLKIVIFKDN